MTRKGTFCYVCGKVTEELIKGKCRDCYYREAVIMRLPEKPTAKVCGECLSILKHGRWQPQDKGLQEVAKIAAEDVLRDSLVLREVRDEEVNVSLKAVRQLSPKKMLIPFTIGVTGKHHGEDYREERTGKVEVDLALCDSCTKRKGRYYEAVLQVRGGVQEEEVKGRVFDYLEGLKGRDSGAFIADFKTVKNGFDIYVGSHRAGRKAARYLVGKFGGTVRESPKLVGKSRDGRDLYRVSISLRLPRFRVDDVLRHGGKVLQLRDFKGSKAFAYDLESRQRVVLPLKSLNKARILGRKGDMKGAVVTKISPGRVQVLEKSNTWVFNISLPLKAGDKVDIFRDGKDYLLMTDEELR